MHTITEPFPGIEGATLTIHAHHDSDGGSISDMLDEGTLRWERPKDDDRGRSLRVPGDSRSSGLRQDAWYVAPPDVPWPPPPELRQYLTRLATGELSSAVIECVVTVAGVDVWSHRVGGYEVGSWGTDEDDMRTAAEDIMPSAEKVRTAINEHVSRLRALVDALNTAGGDK